MKANERYLRQSFLGEDSAAVLRASRGGIVGAGGGGSHVAQQLAHAGLGTFDVFDPDVMEEPNLNRTIGSEPRHAADAARKIDVAASLIQRINPAARVNLHFGKWESSPAALRQCNGVVGCVDGFAARSYLERYCRRYHVPYIDIGMDVHEVGDHFLISGQIITSVPGGPCMRCMGFLTDELVDKEVQAYGAAGARPQVVWSNGVLASTAVGIFVRLRCNWTGSPLNPYVEYDGNRDTLQPSRRFQQRAWKACPHFSAAHDLGDVDWGGYK